MSEEQPGSDASNNDLDGASAKGPQLAIKRLFIKDLSFEAPLGAEGFNRQVQPTVNQDIGTGVTKIDEQHYEVVLHLTVAVKDGDSTLYMVELQQAGVFMVSGLEQTMLAQVLNTHCPTVLFPYARAVVDDMAVKGGFPPLMLPPVNFEILFQQALAKRAASAETQTQPSTDQPH